MAVSEQWLPFERELAALQERLRNADTADQREALARELDTRQRDMLAGLTAWQRVQLARHPQRPRMLDYTMRLFDDFVELHGDRAVGDDPAMICGFGRFRGRTVFVVGHQKGVSTDEKVKRHFGMAHPWGYRKAIRVFKLAERLGHPVLTFVDTPAAHPGVEAEQFGQGPLIAQSLLVCAGLRTPVFSVVLSEGGSGGALGIALADQVAMFEYAVYMICPPERCAEILWRDVDKREQAAEAMGVTAQDLHRLGVIDTVLPEPGGGAHRNPEGAAEVLAEEIQRFLDGCDRGVWTLERRQEKYRAMGAWELGSGHGTD